MHAPRPFLRAEWRHLAILNFEIDPAVLVPFVPRGTRLDTWHGRTCVSVVGFLFQRPRVLGLPIPFHRSFEEINLRFYVRRDAPDGLRRGVVFIREIAPRPLIALGAALFYNEHYTCLPMHHCLARDAADPAHVTSIVYHWRLADRDWHLQMDTPSAPAAVQPGTFDEFIIEHYWGYGTARTGRTLEYRVDHPPWRVAPASAAHFDCDVARLYGPQFVDALTAPPLSAFLADGSAVAVYPAQRLAREFQPATVPAPDALGHSTVPGVLDA